MVMSLCRFPLFKQLNWLKHFSCWSLKFAMSPFQQLPGERLRWQNLVAAGDEPLATVCVCGVRWGGGGDGWHILPNPQRLWGGRGRSHVPWLSTGAVGRSYCLYAGGDSRVSAGLPSLRGGAPKKELMLVGIRARADRAYLNPQPNTGTLKNFNVSNHMCFVYLVF